MGTLEWTHVGGHSLVFWTNPCLGGPDGPWMGLGWALDGPGSSFSVQSQRKAPITSVTIGDQLVRLPQAVHRLIDP